MKPLPDNVVSLLRHISHKRNVLAMQGDAVVNEFNSHRLYPPFPVVVKLNERAPVPGAPFGGDCFLVECFTLSGDGETYVAHILDYRTMSDGHPMKRSIAQRFYEVVSAIPMRYGEAGEPCSIFHLSYNEVRNAESVTHY